MLKVRTLSEKMLKLLIITLLTVNSIYTIAEIIHPETQEESSGDYLVYHVISNEFDKNDVFEKKLKDLEEDLTITKAELKITKERLEENERNEKFALSYWNFLFENSKTAFSNLKKEFLQTKEEIKSTKEELKLIKEGLAKTDENLKILSAFHPNINEKKRPEITNDVLNKDIGHYQLFTDIDGKNKSFIIPLIAMNKTYKFYDSVNLCRVFNSTLIEIKSLEKQEIVESFLDQLGSEFIKYKLFWINGHKDSDHNWKWMNSGEEFTFTNWETSFPKNKWGPYIYVSTSSALFGKWANTGDGTLLDVICEHTL